MKNATHIHALSLILSGALIGCSGEVTSGTHRGECADALDVRPPVALSGAKSASFHGDVIHLEGSLGGEAHYWALAIESDTTARVANDLHDLTGRADLAPLAEGRHVRARPVEEGVRIEVMDTSDPKAPSILADFMVGGIGDALEAFSADGDHVFFAARPAPDAEWELYTVDLADPAHPGETQMIPSFLGYVPPEGRFLAAGSTWVTWNVPSGNWAEQVRMYAVTPEDADLTVDYAYNQTGVHHYGDVITAATDGARAVFDPENKSLFLVTDIGGSFNWVTFGVSTERRLLGVVDQTAYVITPEGLYAYDVSDIYNAPKTAFYAAIAFTSDDVRLLASSDRYLLVADGGEALYLVPRDVSGPVSPLRVVQGELPAACAE